MLLVLLLAVLVPTACVLWFMNAAMKNERLAVRQKLEDMYCQELLKVAARTDEFWANRLTQAWEVSSGSASETFAVLVTSGLVDAAIIYDQSGNVLYPAERSGAETIQQPPSEWSRAETLEYEFAKPIEAADAYAQIASEAKDANIEGRGLQAQMRCLIKAERNKEALKIIAGPLAKPELQNVTDSRGGLIVPNCQLLAIQLIDDPKDKEVKRIVEQLIRKISDYSQPNMPSAQRVFIMQAILDRSLADASVTPTLEAEELAAEYLEGSRPPVKAGILTDAGGFYHVASPDKQTVLLFRSFHTDFGPFPYDNDLIQSIGTVPAGTSGDFVSVPASKYVEGIETAAWFVEDPFTVAAKRQNAIYLWTGVMGIVVISILALLVAGHIGRQMKLTRLKNDLIATVSHELKTPLASMRVLVDTLLEGRCKDQQQAKEYFRLIAKENKRLTRLIDNFLTFSRMERNKKAFEFDDADINEIVATAVGSVRERFNSSQCYLDVKVAPNLPSINVDRDALITVVLNLLDNAWKYSGDKKRINLRTFQADGSVCLDVSDNGIGMSPRVAKKIFNRFYQVDQTLSRKAGGCGLGLSIVKFILDAHGGSISIKSQPNEGSTFTVQLPFSKINLNSEQ